jgi:parallel beta-helix repeat protein
LFTISSAGIPAEINVRQNSSNIPNAVGSFDFGYVNLGWDEAVTFTIENLGGVDLALTGSPLVQITGPDADKFVVTIQPTTPIASMDSTTFEITFTPDLEGEYSAAVSISNSDSDENPYLFSIVGQGTYPRTLYVDDNALNDPGPNNPAISDPCEDGSQEHPFDMVQEAIDVAFHEEDVVIVLPGTFYENITLLGKNITVTGTDPGDSATVAATIIDGVSSGPVVSFLASEGPDCHLTGLTVTNGFGSLVDFAGSDAMAGGGILCINSSPTISHCVISSSKTELGGGVYCSDSDIQIIDCQIVGNSAVSYHGGGIYATNSSRPQIINSTILKNGAAMCGGGIASQIGSSPQIVATKLCYNQAKSAGGIYIANSSDTYIVNTLICNNTSVGTSSYKTYDGGGAMVLWGAPVLCENTLFYGNSANVEGGAIQCAYTNGVVLNNCIFWANSAPSGYHIYLRYTQGSTSFPSTMTGSYSDWEGGKTGVVVDPGCTFTWGPGNFEKDPLFADAAGGDFHLLSKYGRWDPASQSWVYDKYTSACIDAGDPSSDWTAELWPHGKRINVSPYGNTPQASMSGSTAGNICDFNNDGAVDLLDMASFVEVWLYDDVLLAENVDHLGYVDLTDYSICAANWLWNE